jgi:hypothetical protein
MIAYHCDIGTLRRLAGCSRQLRSQVQGELLPQHFVRLLSDALALPSALEVPSCSDHRDNRMRWLCTAVGSEFIRSEAAAISSACLQAARVELPTAVELAAAGLEIPYAKVLAAAAQAACLQESRPVSCAAVWICSGAVPDAAAVAGTVCRFPGSSHMEVNI